MVIDLRVKEEMCEFLKDSTECQPNAEFHEFFTSKTLIMYHNQRRFVSDKYDGPPISTESLFEWIEFSKIQTSSYFSVKETLITHNDSLLGNYGALTRNENKAFTIEESSTVLKDFNPYTR